MRGRVPRGGAVLLAVVLAGVGCATDEPRLATGPHAQLRCDDCHGPRGEDGAVGFASAEACEKCHHPEEMSLYVETDGVRFPHRPHWQLLAGLESSCSACHTHAGGDADLTVDESHCYLCHAVVPGPGAKVHRAFFPEGSCLECHGPETHTALAGLTVPVDHGAILDRGIECTICHHDVLVGTGAVRDRVCQTCHAAPDVAEAPRSQDGADVALLHQQHFQEGRPACSRCHSELEHRDAGVAGADDMACENCHAPEDPVLAAPRDSTVHRPQQLLYAGLAAEHEEMLPAGKFAARVSCAACHSRESMGHADPLTSVQAMNAECVACHGPGFANILEMWVLGMRSRTESVGRYVRDAAAQPDIRSSVGADSLAQSGLRHWEMVRAGNGVHNIPAAHALLRQALEEAEASWSRAGLAAPAPPTLEPDPRRESCARCHYGIEHSRVPVFGEEFDHRRHVVQEGLACAKCHSPNDLFLDDQRTFDPAHGVTHLTRADCVSCHHASADASSCGICHTDEELARPRPVTLTVSVEGSPERSHGLSWVHAGHPGVACLDCHGALHAGDAGAKDGLCSSCHTDHHAAQRDCAACHQLSQASAVHSRETHRSCDACHSRGTVELLVPDRRFCLVCHSEQESHYEDTGNECTSCHFLASPAEYREHLTTPAGTP